ncbi:hypothetical protein LJ739_03070 [Aestuariibacter halophilus]|uniref:Uncharacterized protein n=1 Tax=Fluctibacter halophilus TaxID=226011 RepID=A0ABS8G3X0_9ALTE|nr:hypothetical protein [Aestuariibacter halophilus]MCC2615223.1 hypothetical protein [Aestuariibacter halophilus]
MTAKSRGNNKPRITIPSSPLTVFGPCDGEGEEDYIVAGARRHEHNPPDDSCISFDDMTEEQYLGTDNTVDEEDISVLGNVAADK